MPQEGVGFSCAQASTLGSAVTQMQTAGRDEWELS